MALGISDSCNFISKPAEVNPVAYVELICMFPRVDLVVKTGVEGRIFIDNVVVHEYLSLDVCQAAVLKLAHK